MGCQIGCDITAIRYSIGRFFRILRHILEPEFGETGLRSSRAADSVALGCAALAPRLFFLTLRYSE